MNSPDFLKRALKERAIQEGFVSVGVSEALPMPEPEKAYRRWLQKGSHATMAYLERDIEKRFNPSLLFKGAASVISLAWAYGHAEMARENKTGIALYAWGEDYHHYLQHKTLPIIHLLESSIPGSVNKFFTDSAYLSERSLAVRGGLGWIGKNGTLITEGYGSMVLLCEIVTSIAIPPDKPYIQEHCGDCSLCIEACPTGAITGSRTLIASRCLSYQTNTHKGEIPSDIAKKLDGRIYGCDACQEVCPWNSKTKKDRDTRSLFSEYPSSWPASAADWLDKDKRWFDHHFKNTALEYKGFEKIQNNARSAVYGSDDSPQE